MPHLINTTEIPLDDIVAALCQTCGDVKPARDAEHYHVTELIRAAVRVSKGKTAIPAVGEKGDYDGLEGLAAWGEMWEAVAANYIRGIVADETDALYGEDAIFTTKLQPQLDDIVGNLDGLLVPIPSDGHAPIVPIVVEMKMKNTSNQQLPTENPAWMMQGLAYCAMTGARQIWWVVLYAGSRPPSYKVMGYLVGVTDSEVLSNWQMLLATKRYLESEVEEQKQEQEQGQVQEQGQEQNESEGSAQ